MGIIKRFISWHEVNGYSFLLAMMVLLILLPPFLLSLPNVAVIIYILVTLVLLNCFLILFGHSHQHWMVIVLFVLVLSYLWYDLLISANNVLYKLGNNVVIAIFFSLTFAKIVRTIFKLKKVTAKVVVGAIGAYLLLGLVGAFIFEIVTILYPDSFSNTEIFSGFYGEIYLSFITISTLGYGDITPITPQGQAAAIFVAISGQLYLAILMAMLVGKFLKDSDW